jgi:hypothetical protein
VTALHSSSDHQEVLDDDKYKSQVGDSAMDIMIKTTVGAPELWRLTVVNIMLSKMNDIIIFPRDSEIVGSVAVLLGNDGAVLEILW